MKQITISDTVKNGILKKMVEKDIKEIEMYGIIFSTTKTNNSIPTGYLLKSGEEIYIQP